MGGDAAVVSRSGMPAAIRLATAMIVIIGFTRSDVGKSPESAT